MVKYSDERLNLVFSALSDTTRRAILTRLADRPRTVTELAGPFDMSLPAVSKHLRVLEGAGLIHKQRDGRLQRCTLEATTLKTANDWLAQYERFWIATRPPDLAQGEPFVVSGEYREVELAQDLLAG